MRNFSKVMIRVCVLLLFVIGLESAIRFCCENWKLATVMSKQERKELEGTLDTLYCGTSIAYCAYNPVILDEKLGTSSFNLGTASQPCVGTYHLVRETAEKNPIKEIYLTISIPTLKAERLPQRYLSAFETMRSLKWKLGYLAAVKDNDLTTQALFYSTRVEPEEYTKTKKIRSNIENKKNPGKKVEGYEERGFRTCEKYYHSEGPIKNSKNNYWFGEQGDAQLDPEAVTYMKKLAAFCKKKDIKMTMVVVPWSQDYIDAAGDLDDMDRVCRELTEEMGIEYYNFLLYKNREKLFTNYVFKDEQHLNTTGGNLFSALLADVVASEDPDSYFYESMADFEKAEEESEAVNGKITQSLAGVS